MELFDKDFNEVCAKWTMVHFLREGIVLKPQEIKREIKNRAKEWGVPEKKVAEAHKAMYGFIVNKTMSVIDEMITGKVEE
ncbi:MAG TPA: hypothetical protein VK153_03835 [Candidatus Paceibacterota bacterium]|nr:hypothetical protein [Candidatus Paceibacterota bacterium]